MTALRRLVVVILLTPGCSTVLEARYDHRINPDQTVSAAIKMEDRR